MSLERTHPISCACSICFAHNYALEQELRRDLAQQDGEPLSALAEAIPFERREWHQDPKEIARLFRWLTGIEGVEIRDPASFIEHAATWQAQYDEMRSYAP